MYSSSAGHHVTQHKDIFPPSDCRADILPQTNAALKKNNLRPPAAGFGRSSIRTPCHPPYPHLLSPPLRQESQVDASEKGAFDVGAAARTGKREIWVCLFFFPPRGYTTERTRRYFKMPPSSGFPFIHKMSSTVGARGWGGVRTLLPASPGSLCNVSVDPSPPHQKKGLPQHATGRGGVRGRVATKGCDEGLFLLLSINYFFD